MRKEREDEIKQMGREAQEARLFELREKYNMANPQPLVPGQPVPMHDARELVADHEEMELLEELLWAEEE